MKRLILIVCALLISNALLADTQCDDWPENDIIGLFGDEGAYTLDTPIVPYIPIDVYLIAILRTSFESGIRSARFRLENLPSNDGYPDGQYTFEFACDHFSGDISTEIEISWDNSIGAGHGIVQIATFEFLMFDEMWIGPEYEIAVRPGMDCGCLEVVDGNGLFLPAAGCAFFFNCSPYDSCYDYSPSNNCVVGPLVAVENSSWSHVKALF